jgi:hypothetical protein
MATPFGLISITCLLHSLHHILNCLLHITKNDHGFNQIEEFDIKTNKKRELKDIKNLICLIKKE